METSASGATGTSDRPEPEPVRVVVIGGSGFDFPLERDFPVLLPDEK